MSDKIEDADKFWSQPVEGAKPSAGGSLPDADSFWGPATPAEPPKPSIARRVMDAAVSAGRTLGDILPENPPAPVREGPRRGTLASGARPYVAGGDMPLPEPAPAPAPPPSKPTAGNATLPAPRNSAEALDDVVNDLEAGADIDQMRAAVERAGVPWSAVVQHAQRRGSPLVGADHTGGARATGEPAPAGNMQAREPGTIESVGNALTRAQHTIGRNVDTLAHEAGLHSDESFAGEFARRSRAIAGATPSLQNVEGQQAIGAAGELGLPETLDAMRQNPVSAFTMLADAMLQSLPSSAVAGTAGAVFGGAPGAAAGAGMASAAQEYASALVGAIEESGLDPRNPQHVLVAMRNEDVMNAAREKGVKRGLIVGAFDALSAGIAGKFIAPAVQAVRSGEMAGAQAVRKVGGAAAKEAGTQAATGAGGEFAAQTAVGERNWADVVLEGLAEVPGGAAEAAGNMAHAARAKPAAQQLRPTEQRKAVADRLDDFAATHGVPGQTLDLIKKAAERLPLAKVAGFYKGALSKLAQAGKIQAQIDDAALSTLDEPAPQPAPAADTGAIDAAELLGTIEDDGAGLADTGAPDGLRRDEPGRVAAGGPADAGAGAGNAGLVPSEQPGEGAAGPARGAVSGAVPGGAVAPDGRTAVNDALRAMTPRPIVGERIDGEWVGFAPESGTLAVPRADMPQIKAEHRGAMTNFLNARGITHEQREVSAIDLKPTQAEFSTAKVKQAREFVGGDRSILVSSDGHVLDGHHQWLAKVASGEPIKAIVLNAPIADLLPIVREFPSAQASEGAQPAATAAQTSEPPRAPGTVRLYHGGEPGDAKGPLWFSRERKYAEGYADKSGARTWFVDVPADHPLVQRDDEFGVEPPTNVELPADLAVQRKPLTTAPASPAPDKRAARARARRALDVERDTLLQALSKLGGIRRDVVAREFGLKPEELKHTVSVGGLKGFPFRAKGGMDLDSAMTALQEAGYFRGVPDEDVRRAFEEAIYNEMGGAPTLTAEGQMRQAAARAEDQAAQADPFDPFTLDDDEVRAVDGYTADDLEESGYADASDEVKAATQALLAEAEAVGIDTEAVREDAARLTQEQTEDAYHAEVQRLAREALAAARGAPAGAEPEGARGSAADRGQAAGDQGQEADEGLTLAAQDAAELQAKAEREARAVADDAREQKRLTDKAKADAQRGEFALTGSDRAADVAAAAGQRGMFDEPAASEDIEQLLREHGEQVTSSMDAMRRWNDGDRIFAAHEQSEDDPVEVRSLEMLQSYAPDQLTAVPGGPRRAADKPTPAPRHIANAGRTPNATEPLALRTNPDGTLTPLLGGKELLDFDSGEPIVLPAGTSDLDAKKAIRAAGAVSKKVNFFPVKGEAKAEAPAPASEFARRVDSALGERGITVERGSRSHAGGEPGARRITLADMPEAEFMAKHGNSAEDVKAHEFAHTYWAGATGLPNFADPRNRALKDELSKVSRLFRPYVWEHHADHARKASELLADGLAFWAKHPARRAEFPLLDQLIRSYDAGDLVRTFPDSAAQAPRAANSRDAFTLQRLNRDTNEMEPVTFERGEYVRFRVGKTEHFGDIDGISHARREFSVDGLWHAFGFAYKAERPAPPKKKTEPLSRTIERVNKKFGDGLTDDDAVPGAAASTAGATDRFPPVAQFDQVSVGPGGRITPRTVAPGKHTYRETDAGGLDDVLRYDSQAEPFNAFVADSPDLAIGQGDNRGVHIVFRPDSISGREHAKPMTGDMVGREYRANLIAPRAVQTITMDAAAVPKLRALTRRRLTEEFDRENLPSGRVRFHRKGLERLAPPEPVVEAAEPSKKSRRARKAATSKTAKTDDVALSVSESPDSSKGRGDTPLNQGKAATLSASTEKQTEPRYTPDPNEGHRAIVAALEATFARGSDRAGRYSLVPLVGDALPPGIRAARALARGVFAHETILVRQPNGRIFDGASSAAPQFDIVLIDVDTPRPAMAVLGHELLHRLRAKRPELYDQLRARLGPLLRNEAKYGAALNARRAAKGLPPIDAETLSEELTADIVGDEFMQPEFWRAFANEDRSLFRKVADFVLGVLDDILRKVKRMRPFGTDQYLSDVEAARAAIVDVMREFARRQSSNGTDTAAEGFSLSVADDTARAAPEARPPGAPRPSTGLLDRTLRLAGGDLLGRLTSAGHTRLLEVLDAGATAIVGRPYLYAKAGLVADHGLTPDYKRARADMRTGIRKGTRSAATVIEQLQTLDRAQSRIAHLWMQEKPDTEAEQALLAQLPEESRGTLLALKKHMDDLGKQAVELGLLSQETYERNAMAYLHRSYRKYELDDPKARAARSRAVKILGNQFKGRGLRDDVAMDKIGSPDFWQRKERAGRADTTLKGEKFHRLELRALPDGATAPLIDGGKQAPLGKLRQVAYWPEGEPIPARYADWRNDGLWEARFFDKAGKVGMWRDFTLAERTAMGEIQEVRYSAAKTMLQAVRDIENARLLDWVARNAAVPAEDRIPDGAELVPATEKLTRPYLETEWVQVPESVIPGTGGLRRYGNLAGRFIPGPVWNDLRQVQSLSQEGDLAELWGRALRAWKVSKTALSPATHTNNVLSNFILADAHDIQARHMLKAAQAWFSHVDRPKIGRKADPAAKKLIEDYQDNGGDGGKFNEGELREDVMGELLEQLERDVNQQKGATALLSAAQVFDLLRAREFRQAFAAIGQTKTAGQMGRPVKALVKLYGHEDELFRLAAFIKAREDGLADREAGRFAHESFLDYNINAPWVQAMRRTAFPFIAFTYRAVPMLLRAFADKPHKLAKYLLVAGALNSLAYGMLGDDGDEDKERALLPDEKDGKIWGIFPKLMRMPWNDEHASPVFLDVRRWIPGGDVIDTGQNHAAVPVPSPLLPGGPLVILAELVLNKQSFTGKDITLDSDTLAEKWEKSAGYLWRSAAPNFPGLPGTYATDTIIDAGTGKTDVFGRERSLGQATLSTLGVKVASYPPDALRRNAALEAQAKIREIQRGLSSDARQVGRKGMTREEYEERARRAAEKIRDTSQALRDKLDRAEAR